MTRRSRRIFRRLDGFAVILIAVHLCSVLARDGNHTASPTSSKRQPPFGSASNSNDDTLPPRKHVLVNIPGYGKVQGAREGGIDFFGAIPYAAPPVGNLRFAPPEPPTPWAKTSLVATHYGPDCWQLVDRVSNPSITVDSMSEDCLYLNVFTPAGQAHSKKRLPVMVWLHGGGFQQGGARRPEYDGRRLAERGIVVVTLNYRLGALGFLVSSSDGLYGNFGLMDQRAALDWVARNIRVFGGDPENITLFGESAGAVMIGLHLMMEGAGTIFHRAIMQSNPLGYTFRSVVVADFIGSALKRGVDCRDLACLRTERVEEIMRAQSSLMGMPRSVGDFFTWGPTLTREMKVTFGGSSSSSHSSAPFGMMSRYEEHRLFRNADARWQNSDAARWSAVNVSQPMKGLHLVPDSIPILIGSNKHEGEMFVHTAFPAPMPKAVYWMFVGALFRDSASRVLKHYRGYVDQVEREAEDMARKQIEEQENRIYYEEHKDQLEREYEELMVINATRNPMISHNNHGVHALLGTWGGAQDEIPRHGNGTISRRRRLWPFGGARENETTRADRMAERARLREERRVERKRAKALKAAAKVVVDYRPVMSRIIDDYLFRCPTWHYAHLISKDRERRGRNMNNVYVYRFSQPTYIPGYDECWGKSCHTSELPYAFQSMEIIRSNYSTVSLIAQRDAPSAPSYPYTEMLNAYRGALESFDSYFNETESRTGGAARRNQPRMDTNRTHAFNKILNHFFGDYFQDDPDEEIANDMAERWAAFAKTGDPNYDGSLAEWIPWRFETEVVEDDWDVSDNENGDNPWVMDGEYDYWSDIDEYDTEEQDEVWAHQDREGKAYRRRALAALNMEVVEEDVFRTELRRRSSGPNEDDLDKTFLSSRFLFRSSLNWKNPKEEKAGPSISRRSVREIIRVAQEIGALGIGLAAEERWPDVNSDLDFFPEILELKWPPEGRVIERDCTCDLWDEIRYRY